MVPRIDTQKPVVQVLVEDCPSEHHRAQAPEIRQARGIEDPTQPFPTRIGLELSVDDSAISLVMSYFAGMGA